MGYNIILRACRAPVTQIAANAGQDGGIVCEKVSEAKGNVGYNAATGVYEDLVKAGVIDPTKVTRTALQNASSVATLLLTSDALIAEKPKEEKKPPPATAATTTCTKVDRPPPLEPRLEPVLAREFANAGKGHGSKGLVAEGRSTYSYPLPTRRLGDFPRRRFLFNARQKCQTEESPRIEHGGNTDQDSECSDLFRV